MCLLTLLKEGKGQPSPKCCVWHSTPSWEITALEPGLQGLQIPCTKTVLLRQTNHSHLCPAQRAWKWQAVFAQVTLSHSLRCELPHLQEQGGRCTAWERLREGGSFAPHLWSSRYAARRLFMSTRLSHYDLQYSKIRYKKRPQTETIPCSTNSDGRNRFSTPADFIPKPTSV